MPYAGYLEGSRGLPRRDDLAGCVLRAERGDRARRRR